MALTPLTHPDQLTHRYPPAELDGILAVLTKLLHAQRTVLAVNRAYIASAAQSDASRTEPPFRLQGSYRDMNNLAERITPVMNDAELDALVDDHYRAEAQTRTSAAEANFLKLAEIGGTLTPCRLRAGTRSRQRCRIPHAHERNLHTPLTPPSDPRPSLSDRPPVPAWRSPTPRPPGYARTSAICAVRSAIAGGAESSDRNPGL
nr:hypothetical protein [Actinacidiphila soli]